MLWEESFVLGMFNSHAFARLPFSHPALGEENRSEGSQAAVSAAVAHLSHSLNTSNRHNVMESPLLPTKETKPESTAISQTLEATWLGVRGTG